MGFRFSKGIRLGAGFRLNLSTRGLGLSAGVRGFRVGIGPRGLKSTFSLPGTGLSYVKTQSLRSTSRASLQAVSSQEYDNTPPTPQPIPIPLFAPEPEKEFIKALNSYIFGDKDEALKHFYNVSVVEPAACIFAAVMYSDRGKHELAAQLLEQVVLGHYTFPTPLMEKYLQKSTFGVTITEHVTASVYMGASAAALMLVDEYKALNKFPNAVGILEELLDINKDPILILSLCNLYAKLNVWQGISEHGAGIPNVDDITLEITMLYGRSLYMLRLFDAAVAKFTEALRIKRNRSRELLTESRYWRALCYHQLGKETKSQKELQIVFAEDPTMYDTAARLNILH